MPLLIAVFEVFNYVLALLFWTMLGRTVLGFFVQPESTNYIWRFFRRLTDPIIVRVLPITPGFLPPGFYPLYAGFYLMLARFLLLFSILLVQVYTKDASIPLSHALLGAGYFAALNVFSFRSAFIF